MMQTCINFKYSCFVVATPGGIDWKGWFCVVVMVWQECLPTLPLRTTSWPSNQHQLNLGLIQYFKISSKYDRTKTSNIWNLNPRYSWNDFEFTLKDLKYIYHRNDNNFQQSFNTCKKKITRLLNGSSFSKISLPRIDPPRHFDLPQLKNSLEVKPFPPHRLLFLQDFPLFPFFFSSFHNTHLP